MTNWKSKYLEMKLKYINAKQKGGGQKDHSMWQSSMRQSSAPQSSMRQSSAPQSSMRQSSAVHNNNTTQSSVPDMIRIDKSMRLVIDGLAVDIRRTHNISKMIQIIEVMNINTVFNNYIINNHNDTYCLILLQFVREEITNNHNLFVPPAFDNGNGRVDINKIIPHLITTSTVFTSTDILEDILFTLHNSHMIREESKIDLAVQIANLINNHGAIINQALITSDSNIDNYNIVIIRSFIYAQLQYIHNIPIYNYFVNENLANMPTSQVVDNNGNYITDIVDQPTRAYYATYADANQAYADAIIQYYMQIYKLQLNIRHSILVGGLDWVINDTSSLMGKSQEIRLVLLQGRIRRLTLLNNYVNYYNP